MKILGTTVIAFFFTTITLSCSKADTGADPHEDKMEFPQNEDGKYTVSSIFSDGMVLQRNSEVAIFGTAERGRAITVKGSWSDQEVTVFPYLDGKYIARIKTPDAGGPYTLSVNDSLYTDVMIGEVWMCSGQSNMHFTLAQAWYNGVNGENNPNVRVYRVPVANAAEPQQAIGDGSWLYGKTNDIGNKVTAVGYYFARILNKELNVPIGIIAATQGGTAVEEWMSLKTFETMPENIRSQFTPTDTKWPGCRYNAMICPLFPYTVAGTIWYQGENNWNRSDGYRQLLPAMIDEWRTGFENRDMPFYLVQLTSFSTKWMEMREAQEEIADRTPYSGYVPTIDLGEQSNIHPRQKRPVGERLAEIALAKHYQMDGFRSSGPRYSRMEKEGDRIRIYFDHIGEGLMLKSGDTPQYFEICGADGIYHPANTLLENNTVVVWSELVPVPVDVRYFWVGFGTPNLFSQDGWPVAQFRTSKQ